MVPTDSFNAELVKLVRNMSDEAILALVKNQLGLVAGSSALAALGAKAAPAKVAVAPAKLGRPAKAAKPALAPAKPAKVAKPAKAAKVAKKGRGRTRLDRSETLSAVERAVKSSNGLAASDIARVTGLPQSRAAAALKELKLAKRIFQGGDRRFARYAGDQRSADTASLAARKTAGGPGKK
jgi:hypothetical protein